VPVLTWVLKDGPRLQRAERLGRLVGARNEKILVRTEFLPQSNVPTKLHKNGIGFSGNLGYKSGDEGWETRDGLQIEL